MPSRTTLSDNWEFTQLPSVRLPETKASWSKCSKFPTSVHVELMKQKKIPDPYKDLHEWDVQWVGEVDWAFRTTFTATKDQLREPEVDLVFDGLDTYCDIELNGKKIAHVENMFHGHRIACKEYLKEGKNDLVLTFQSAWDESYKEAHKHNDFGTVSNGTLNRLYARKAQYNWGWDWGPVLMTAGPWRPVHLEAYSHRFSDVRIDTSLAAPDYRNASLKASIELSPAPRSSSDYQVKATLRTRAGKVIKETTESLAKNLLDWKLSDKEVEAWWPVGYGKQPLYELELSLQDKKGNELANSVSRTFFRDAQVVQDKLVDQPGTTFLFQVNGVRIFCGGSNWIPADNFLTEITAERYRKWVELLVSGNQNMLRVWGGGVYEDQALYDACDELGVLVWQDFMFGCGLYPSYDEINKSIKSEAEEVVARLRNHASVVIFAGNNEDYQMAEAAGVIDYNDESGKYLDSKFPARHIYEILLPEVVNRLSNVFYWRSSPYGGTGTTDRTIGDIHQWNVWHGSQEPWSNWDILSGRFVSEFGMQGYPNIRTINEWSNDKKQLFPQSRVSVQHNKADGFERRLELYLMENFRHAFDMESYVYYTQVMQAECLSAAYRLWRREWRGKGKEYTAGALVWQINDCWPCVSWAICDYYLRPKPAFFAIARELRPFTVGMARKDVKTSADKDTNSFFKIEQEIQVWGCNSTLSDKKAKVDFVSFDLDEGELDRRTFNVVLAANSSTEIWRGHVPGQPTRTSDGQVPKPIVVQARLIDGESGEVLARYSNWPEPWKYLLFPDPGLDIKVDGDEVTLSCKTPIKGLILDTEGDECIWSDNAVDLFPGDVQKVTARGLKGRKVKARYLGDGSA